jgi:phytoene synthase
LHDAERHETVRRIARAGDADRALTALFAPREARDDLLTLYAFNAELARIADQVSSPDLGAIRLQWWREAVERARNGETTGHPVADAFGAVLRCRGLSPERIAALIDARCFDVGETIMPDAKTLDAYLFNTASTLFALAAEIAGPERDTLAQVSQAAGKAYGLTGLMRALPMHAARGRVYLPADALVRYGTSPEEVLAGATSEGLELLLAETRDEARRALGEARSHLAKLAPSGRTAFLPLSLVDPYLAALETKGRDPLREVADINPLYRLWRMTTWR